MTQLVFAIPDMTCGHCRAAVTKAIGSVDPQARVEVDLDRHTASVNSAARVEALIAALANAGYAAELTR